MRIAALFRSNWQPKGFGPNSWSTNKGSSRALTCGVGMNMRMRGGDQIEIDLAPEAEEIRPFPVGVAGSQRIVERTCEVRGPHRGAYWEEGA